MQLREERMADFFVKHHVEGLRVPAVFHRFTDVDLGDPHDHPWPFTSLIVSGGYVEEVFAPDGSVERVEHRPGESFHVPADHVHRIVHHFEGVTETLILPGPWVRQPGFWRFEDGQAFRRQWDGAEFAPVEATGAGKRVAA